MKILLCCNAGMSSSILVKKIRDIAEKTGEDIEVSKWLMLQSKMKWVNGMYA